MFVSQLYWLFVFSRVCQNGIPYFYRREQTIYKMSTSSWEQLAQQNSTHPKLSYSYSLPLALLPPALPSYQRENSSLICPISCTILLCSPTLPRTCAFLCFHKLHATKITKVSNFRLSALRILALTSSHHPDSSLSICGGFN